MVGRVGNDNRDALWFVGPVIFEVDSVFVLLPCFFQGVLIRGLQIIGISIDDVPCGGLFCFVSVGEVVGHNLFGNSIALIVGDIFQFLRQFVHTLFPFAQGC